MYRFNGDYYIMAEACTDQRAETRREPGVGQLGGGRQDMVAREGLRLLPGRPLACRLPWREEGRYEADGKEMTMWYSTVGGIVMLILSLLVTPPVAQAQPLSRVPRIGVQGDGSPTAPSLAAFRQGLR